LTVTAANATQVTIAGSDGTTYTLPATGGAATVTPTATTTYTASATGPAGTTTATATATVTVTAAVTAPTVTITANPKSIAAGASSVLTVTATSATKVTIAGSDGTTYTLPTTGGSATVTPAATTTYTASAVGSAGTTTATATATVTVTAAVAAPTVTITANPTSIVAGASSILTVTATNATQVAIAGSDGTTYNLSATGGTQPVTPGATTTYTATAVGAGGTATAKTTITVSANPVPTVTIAASPASITAGSSSTITVTAVNATQVTVTGSDNTTYPLTASGGAATVTPTATTTYTATAVGPGGTTTATAQVTVTPNPTPTVTIVANPTSIIAGNSSVLTVTATNATGVTVSASTGGTPYTLSATGGTETVMPAATTTYTATATGAGGTANAGATVTVTGGGTVKSIDHVIFMLQENHTFDNYFGMLNPYRQAQGMNVGDDGVTYNVDGIDDKLATTSNSDDEGTAYPLFPLTSTCIDDESSAWLASYGDVNTYDFLAPRPILMDGFVHNAEGYAKSCAQPGSGCSGAFTDLTGQRSMGYYDQNTLNYYYYMASQFAVSDRWFSPVSSKSIDNRIATFTGGTTQGLVKDPGGDDHLPQLNIATIFQELDAAKVSWKVYYTVTQGFCLDYDDCPTGGNSRYPATDFSILNYSYNFLQENPAPGPNATCPAPLQTSSVVGDSTNSFCIDPTHIAPLNPDYFNDLKNGTLPSFAFIEAGYGNNDEHPGSGQSIMEGQAQVANVVNSLMTSPSWSDSVFFFSYDEGGGPYDHVPPVPGYSNQNTDAALGTIPDISAIAVNPDSYNPCLPAGGTPTTNCDLAADDPGANSGDAAAMSGFAAQLGFRLPNAIISPFTRRHYVSHTPMDHTAIIKFVENRFIGSAAHLTARDAAQPDLLEFFDFTGVPWATPPTPPTPIGVGSTCTPTTFSAKKSNK
jgi:phospholipase C